MGEPGLLVLCGVAFLTVLVVLGALAGLIEALVRLFPAQVGGAIAPGNAPPPAGGAPGGITSGPADTAAVVAAIHAVVAVHHPHLTVTAIQERQDR
jgi:hypothetical protein